MTDFFNNGENMQVTCFKNYSQLAAFCYKIECLYCNILKGAFLFLESHNKTYFSWIPVHLQIFPKIRLHP